MDITNVDIKSICIRDDLGKKWNFTEADKNLEKVRIALTHLINVPNDDDLTTKDKNAINKGVNQLMELLNKIQSFDNTIHENTLEKHDELENESVRFADRTLQELRPILDHLAISELSDDKNLIGLKRKQLEAEEAKNNFNRMSNELQNSFSEIKKQSDEIRTISKQLNQSKHGEIASAVSAKHFIEERDVYKLMADKWFRKIKWSITLAFIGTIDILIAYLYFVEQEKYKNSLWQLGVAKLALIGMIWYVVSLIVHNYNVNSHLSAVNRHRAAVAQTLKDFMAANPERQSDMLKYGTEAMFKHAPIGFIRKAEKEPSNPLMEIINNIPGLNSLDKQ